MKTSRELDLLLIRKLIEKLGDKDPRVRRNATGACACKAQKRQAQCRQFHVF